MTKPPHLTEDTLEEFDMLDEVLAAAGIPLQIDRGKSTEAKIAVAMVSSECTRQMAAELLRSVAAVFMTIAEACDREPEPST